MLGGGGVDGAIHRAAGPELLAECRTLGGCETGQAKLTGAYRLPCRYIIHTVGPIWRGGKSGEPELLASCYRNSLKLAAEKHCETVAFPLISAGAYGYPRGEAMRIARETIAAFLREHELTVYLLVFGRADYLEGTRQFSEIQSYIDDHYADARKDDVSSRRLFGSAAFSRSEFPFQAREASVEDGALPWEAGEVPAPMAAPAAAKRAEKPGEKTPAGKKLPFFLNSDRKRSLDRALGELDESFSQSLLRLIDEKGLTDVQCYKKANIDRKLFSKIRSNDQYRPSKATALAFAVALELSPVETERFLKTAGYALSRSSKFDVIVEYFIRSGNYNIFEINEALFAFDQSLLGA